ncbi:serine hydrolase [Oceanobacillus damuensis]|uniref:serine hydrolase n=1 Tax=Oceanobacillus damuensis TaxID=937928 RepID=UPI00082CC838|nr:serine hydrolase [Oceanobacillus damuensis]
MSLAKLESALLSLINDDRENFSIAVHTDEGNININADKPRQSASLAKLFILAKVYEQVETGSLLLDKLVYIDSKKMVGGSGVISYLTNCHVYSYQNLVELMTIVSDNTASNILLETIGAEQTNQFARKLGCSNTNLGRNFMDQVSRMDGFENVTTACDVCNLLTHFSRENGFFTENSRRNIKKILGNQQFNSKLSSYHQYDSTIKIYHKTGELQGVEHDAAIMEANGNTMEVAVLTEGWSNNGMAQYYLAEIGRMLRNYLVS